PPPASRSISVSLVCGKAIRARAQYGRERLRRHWLERRDGQANARNFIFVPEVRTVKKRRLWVGGPFCVPIALSGWGADLTQVREGRRVAGPPAFAAMPELRSSDHGPHISAYQNLNAG